MPSGAPIIGFEAVKLFFFIFSTALIEKPLPPPTEVDLLFFASPSFPSAKTPAVPGKLAGLAAPAVGGAFTIVKFPLADMFFFKRSLSCARPFLSS